MYDNDERCSGCDARICNCVESSDPTILASCGCGRSYDAAGWLTLKHVGIQDVPTDGDEAAYYLFMSNCTCGSTISVEVHPRQTASMFLMPEPVTEVVRMPRGWGAK